MCLPISLKCIPDIGIEFQYNTNIELIDVFSLYCFYLMCVFLNFFFRISLNLNLQIYITFDNINPEKVWNSCSRNSFKFLTLLKITF